MQTGLLTSLRRTGADLVFEHLHEEILSLRLLPGTKISETEIATKLGVSRQPVRDAFGRLENLGYLTIRPQRSTEVKKFSLKTIAQTRFTRQALETEILFFAAEAWTGCFASAFEENLEAQDAAARANDIDAFQKLDIVFHKLLCEAADRSFVFETIKASKSEITRLCVLSLNDDHEMEELISDHKRILEHVSNKDAVAATGVMRQHLSRLDATVEQIHREHSSFFSDF